MDDLAFRPAAELVRALRRRELRARDLLEVHLDRIDRLDPDLNSVVTLDADSARRRADELDARPEPVGPLHGLPMTVKDAWATAGLRTTCGLVARADAVPVQDAEAVARLRRAGVVVMGKTNVPAEITGQETGNALVGRTVNPWDPRRTPGGSSGGAAAALAAGLTPLELGSDSGGSIRQPAHCCGVYGHVATPGVVPLRGHLPTLDPAEPERPIDLFAGGPMARHAGDLALALPVLADASLAPPTIEGVEGTRVAVWLDDPAVPTSREVRDVLQRAVDALADAGAVIDEPPFPIGAAVRQAFARWLGSPTEQAESAYRERAALERAWSALFDSHDVLLCPISPVVAVVHDPEPAKVHDLERRLAATIDVDGRTRPYLDQMGWNILVGAAGHPATAVPVGRGSSGLPVGAQVVGRPHGDRTTIRFASAMAEVVGGFEPPPAFSRP